MIVFAKKTVGCLGVNVYEGIGYTKRSGCCWLWITLFPTCRRCILLSERSMYLDGHVIFDKICSASSFRMHPASIQMNSVSELYLLNHVSERKICTYPWHVAQTPFSQTKFSRVPLCGTLNASYDFGGSYCSGSRDCCLCQNFSPNLSTACIE